MITGNRVILASGSPRRAALLRGLGVTFDVIPADVTEEVAGGMRPHEVVRELAVRKASAVAADWPDSLVIGADTIVVLDDRIVGKPSDKEDAARTLARLSGREHSVYSGVALLHIRSKRQAIAHEVTKVRFADLDSEEIAAYVAGGSPMDKAGSYGIQEDLGAVFISGIEGDFYNVMGLPVHRMYQLIKNHFPEFVSLRSRLDAVVTK